ncbi:MAG: UMP kinase [Bacteroidetes bacterium]|nr:UMP kinase [Bacteroidota bacterium]
MRYRRILLKLSGESLAGDGAYGISAETLEYYAREIKSVVDKKVQVGIVLGGGNIFRGVQGKAKGFDRVQGDYMGMLATVINSMALQDALMKKGIRCKHLSGIAIDKITEAMCRLRAQEYLEQGYVLLLSGGTGNPFFTTDSAAALRGVEIEADVVFKGTRVDGVYTADPEKNPKAKKYDTLSFAEALKNKLAIMDQTAFTLCQENRLPVVVFNFNKKGNLLKAVEGKKTGTLVSP